MISQKVFDVRRAAVLKARAALDAHEAALCAKYGPRPQESWLKAKERHVRAQRHAAYDRATERFHAMLAASPRQWGRGIPTVWVCEELTYTDAIAPLSATLTVQPPLAYGY